MMLSDKFTEITKHTGLYNIQAISNIRLIMEKGILSNEKAMGIFHKSIALNEVQARRDIVQVPGGLKLHQYANLYFDPWNPMLSRRRDQNHEICILKIDKTILNREGVILSDRNASSAYASFYEVETGLEKIDFDLVYARYWTDENYYEKCRRGSIKCAEVLVPYRIPPQYIVAAAVVSEEAKAKLNANAYTGKIVIEPRLFFRRS